MKNRLSDLNNHLFASLERISEENTKGEALVEEITRAKTVGLTARLIIDNARLALDAQIALGDTVRTLPAMIDVKQAPDDTP